MMERGADIKAKIKETANRLFMEKGFKGVTMDMISKALGMSKKTLYNYYESKEELASEFLADFFREMRERSDTAAEKEEDPAKRLRVKLTRVKEEYLKINPAFFDDIQKYAPAVWQTYLNLREERVKNLEKYIVAGQQKGVFKDIHPRMAVALYLGMTYSLFRTDFLMEAGLTREQAFDMIIEMFVCGLMKVNQRHHPQEG